MLLSGYVTGNGCIVMEKRIWYNFNGLSKLDTKIKTLDSRAIKKIC